VSVAPSIQERFIVLEGLDGSGTTTQMRLLEKQLAGRGARYWPTWEPTDGPIGALIRSILARKTSALPRSIALLYAADRAEHLFSRSGIIERTARGELVISDRYLFSSLAYQSIDLGTAFVEALNGDFPLPECLIFLDTPVEVCQHRIASRAAQELFDGLEFQTRVREGYLDAIDRYRGTGMRIEVIDGDRSSEEISVDIWNVVSSLPTMET
jgi:dTMP kinase